jgi:signal transduction histidine kinase
VRERALLLGGKVEIDASAGGGTSVRLSVPLHRLAGS